MAYSKSNIEKLAIPTLDNVLKFQIDNLLNEAQEMSAPSVKIDKALEDAIVNLGEANKDELIKGLILMQLNDSFDEVDIEEERPRSRRGGRVTRLFVGIGRNDGIKKFTLSELFVKNTNLQNRDINNIDIYDSFSFLEIPSESVNDAIFALADVKYRGRKVSIEEAKEKRRNRRK